MILGGIALLVAGQALLVTQAAVGLGVGLALLALLAIPTTDHRRTEQNQEPRTAESRQETRDTRHENRQRNSGTAEGANRHLFTRAPFTRSPLHPLTTAARVGVTLLPCHLVIGLFLAALALRFYRLGELPYGLWRDEARHALEGAAHPR